MNGVRDRRNPASIDVMISGDEQQAVVFKVQSRRGKAEVLNPLRSNLVLLTLAAEGNIAGKGKNVKILSISLLQENLLCRDEQRVRTPAGFLARVQVGEMQNPEHLGNPIVCCRVEIGSLAR